MQDINEPQTFKAVVDAQRLSNLAANTILTMNHLLMQNTDFSKGLSANDVKEAYIKNSKFYDSKVLRNQLFIKSTDRLLISKEFDRMHALKLEIDKKELSRMRLMFMSASLFFTTQFAVSYYTIFCVPWLGWDLVEPLTYSVSQGSFLLGLLYMARNRGAGTEYTELSDFLKQERKRKWLRKYNFDLHRYHYLQERLRELDASLTSSTEQRFE